MIGRSRCLGAELSEYAAGRLPGERVAEWDRHLIACVACRYDVEQERQLQELMRSGPAMPQSLRTVLLALPTGGGFGGAADPAVQQPGSMGLPGGATPSGPAVLAVVHPAAPPLHRSPLRSAALATAAAGAGVAAVWALSMAAPAAAGAAATEPVKVSPSRAVPAPASQVGRLEQVASFVPSPAP